MTPFSSEALPPPPPVRAVGTVLAGCRIEAVLHAGPVCTVYQAGDAVGAGRFALKEYCPQSLCVRDADGTPRLREPDDAAVHAAFEAGRGACLEELRLLSRLRLPGLVTVLQASETGGGLCGVMPLLPGVTLDRLAPARSDDEVRELLLALLEPLAQLHAAGLVHGGLHAGQLLWAPGQRPVLLGFQSAARALRQSEAFIDAAPELHPEGAHLPRGPWTDLHALACTVLRHTTSGAWDGSTAAADVALALEQALPAPAGRTRQRLVQALQACLRPSPTERPAGAVALRTLLGDVPPAAPPVQPAHPPKRRAEVSSGPAAGVGAGAAGAGAGAPPSADPALAERPGAADEADAQETGPVHAGGRAGARDPFLVETPDARAAPSRHGAGLRAALLLGLPLLALLGYGAWQVQERWQAGQEQERIGRLLERAASQAQAQAQAQAAAATDGATADAAGGSAARSAGAARGAAAGAGAGRPGGRRAAGGAAGSRRGRRPARRRGAHRGAAFCHRPGRSSVAAPRAGTGRAAGAATRGRAAVRRIGVPGAVPGRGRAGLAAGHLRRAAEIRAGALHAPAMCPAGVARPRAVRAGAGVRPRARQPRAATPIGGPRMRCDNSRMSPSSPRVLIQTDDFDLGAEVQQLRQGDAGVGAVVSFVGTVRERSDGAGVSLMELEHYPGMTESAIEAMIDDAFKRFDIRAAKVIHRVGPLKPLDQIVFVAVSSAHRGEAFQACEFLMDYLKTQAPFWKKEHTPQGARWVDARVTDDEALARWGIAAGNAASS